MHLHQPTFSLKLWDKSPQLFKPLSPKCMKPSILGNLNMERNIQTQTLTGTESPFSEPTISQSRVLMMLNYHTPSTKTCSWTWPLKNSRPLTSNCKPVSPPILNTEWEENPSRPPSIGSLKEVFHPLKTKDNADHAGPSQPLVLLNPLSELVTKPRKKAESSPNKI